MQSPRSSWLRAFANKAVSLVLSALTNEKTGVLKSLSEIGAVGHRIVHGGEKFTSSVVITDEVIEAIKEVSDLAPLHNPANLIGVDACKSLMPGTPMVAVFDTAFHQTMPEKAYMYALPLKYYKEYKVRRYGFHGTMTTARPSSATWATAPASLLS